MKNPRLGSEATRPVPPPIVASARQSEPGKNIVGLWRSGDVYLLVRPDLTATFCGETENPRILAGPKSARLQLRFDPYRRVLTDAVGPGGATQEFRVREDHPDQLVWQQHADADQAVFVRLAVTNYSILVIDRDLDW